jgi:hypothetical protein
MSLEIIDVSGEHQLDVSHSLVKTRLDGAGNVIQEDKINLGSSTIIHYDVDLPTLP